MFTGHNVAVLYCDDERIVSRRQVQEARKNHDDEGAKHAIREFDDTIDK